MVRFAGFARSNETRVIACMIVRNESKTISRCLTSMKELIDYFVIEDTGSVDDTIEIINQWSAEHGISGQISFQPFQNFGFNRSQSFEKVKNLIWEPWRSLSHVTNQKERIHFLEELETAVHSYTSKSRIRNLIWDYLGLYNPYRCYAFLIDADMVLVTPAVKDLLQWKSTLSHSCYSIRQQQSNWSYYNYRLLCLDRQWLCKDVTHEYWMTPDSGMTWDKTDVVYFDDKNDGGHKADKHTRDLRLLLEEGLIQDPEHDRYYYYVAQTYFYMGNYPKALEWYGLRSQRANENNPEEKWHAKFMMGRIYLLLDQWENALKTFLEAFNERPTRIEPLYYVIGKYQALNQYATADVFLDYVCKLSYPSHDVGFIDQAIYTYLMLEKVSICSFYVQKHLRGLDACEKIRLNLQVPLENRSRALHNQRFYWKKISCPLVEQLRFQGSHCSLLVASFVTIRKLSEITFNPHVKGQGVAILLLTGSKEIWQLALLDSTSLTVLSRVSLPSLREQEYSLFLFQDEVWILSYSGSREKNQIHIRKMSSASGKVLEDSRPLQKPFLECYEQNWLPHCLPGKPLRFLYSTYPLQWVEYDRKGILLPTSKVSPCNFQINWRNAAGPVSWDQGFLLTVRDVIIQKDEKISSCSHRFIFFDSNMKLIKMSLPFVLLSDPIERITSMVLSGPTLFFSLSLSDGTGKVFAIPRVEIQHLLLDLHWESLTSCGAPFFAGQATV